jgi:hypothetical protein
MPKVRINADAFARLIEAVAERPRSYKTLAEETGLHYTTVRDYINALHRRQQVHVAAMAADSQGRLRVPMWLLGFGKDVKPTKSKTATERKREQRAKEYAQRGKPPRPWRRGKGPVINSVFALGDKANGQPMEQPAEPAKQAEPNGRAKA